MNPSLPLGVDILEWKKAADFYRRHTSRLTTLFSGKELSFIRRSQAPARAFAMMFAAKEAAFKASRRSWLGSSGFKHLSILPGKKGSFFYRPSRQKKLEIRFVTTKKHLVACCAPKEHF